MGKTILEIRGDLFYINGIKVYSELENSNPDAHGLLMNARFIQGIFDDSADRSKYHRFGREFDPEENTNDLIAALPDWHRHGLRACTVGFQGGGPSFTIDNKMIECNPYGPDGTSLDSVYVDRMDRLIKAADALGMVVIVSYFYPGQLRLLKDGRAVMNAVRTASHFLKDGGYTNVIIEVCNEFNLKRHEHSLIYTSEGMVVLMEMAREESGGLPVGCSGGGSYINEEVCKESDVILVHGNNCTRQKLYNDILQVKSWAPNKPVVCNEDSQALGQLEVAFRTHTSWGYYNNLTKQEPPVDWSITRGEDQYFACRMAERIGIHLPTIPEAEQVYLQGLEAEFEYEGKRWIRLASLYPEKIDYVDFYRNKELIYTCYDEPFMVNYRSNYAQGPWYTTSDDKEWKAVIHLRNGEILEKIQEDNESCYMDGVKWKSRF